VSTHIILDVIVDADVDAGGIPSLYCIYRTNVNPTLVTLPHITTPHKTITDSYALSGGNTCKGLELALGSSFSGYTYPPPSSSVNAGARSPFAKGKVDHTIDRTISIVLSPTLPSPSTYSTAYSRKKR